MTDPRVAELGRREALLARMRNVARDVTGDEPVRRVHLTVTMDRFLVRLLATTSWGTWVLKGGYANQLRHPGEARFTEDVDLRIDADIDTANGMIAAAIGHARGGPSTVSRRATGIGRGTVPDGRTSRHSPCRLP